MTTIHKALSSPSASTTSSTPKAVISYRGEKVEITLEHGVLVNDLKEAVLQQSRNVMEKEGGMQVNDLKLMYKGKILKEQDEVVHNNSDDNTNETMSSTTTMPLDALQVLQTIGGGSYKKTVKVYKIVATGVSKVEADVLDADMKHGIQSMARNVRDDLTSQGQRDMERRRRFGKRMMQKAANKKGGGIGNISSGGKYCFGKVETLPNLPNQDEAKKILNSLANDPGILACMKKHQFHVGTLGEMYPDGEVGKSDVCIMGLNENAGQRILLRLRTDDISGFRKMLSIRKVLFHELAHNVHSEHNQEFFKLMRQIEKDCNELDWTNGSGLTSNDDGESDNMFEGGTYRLGVGDNDVDDNSGGASSTTATRKAEDVRDLAARAAMLRMTAEEEMIEQNCGCKTDDLFLPDSEKHSETYLKKK